MSGPAVALVNSNAAVASFTATTDGARVFQLEVNDTRLSSNDTVTVTSTAVVDTDGDGLSDQEELTGEDNALTEPNPAGHTTDPNAADTDGDGAADGAEALAGTDPNDPASTFRVTNASGTGTGFRIEWTATPGRDYRVQFRDQMTGPWSNLTEQITATTAVTNVEDNTAIGQLQRFYQVIVLP